MSSWSRRILALCGAFALALASQAASAKDISIAAISGYFAQGFGVSIVNGLKKAEKDLAVRVKLIDTGNIFLGAEGRHPATNPFTLDRDLRAIADASS